MFTSDAENGEDASGPDGGFEVTPDLGELSGELVDLSSQRVIFEFVASSIATDGDSGSAVEDELVLKYSNFISSLEDSTEIFVSTSITANGSSAHG